MTGASDDALRSRPLRRGAGACLRKSAAELAAGRKRSHWMWFVFPQLEGLGASAMAQRYAIHSLAEARPISSILYWARG